MSIKFHADFLMNQREFSGVFVGKDGYLLADPEKPDKNAVSKTVAAMNAFAEEFSDREMNMILVPDAATILGENLPAKGLNIVEGKVVFKAVADVFGLPYEPLNL